MKEFLLLIFLCTVTTFQAQVTANPPDPIMQCDVFNTGDEMEEFDLIQRETQIINGQSNVVVTFHETSGDALSGTNAFSNPEAYVNIYNPQQVFVRLQSTAGQGWDVTTLEIEVVETTAPEQQPNDLYIDDGDGDGFAEFDLTVNNSVMIGGLNGSDFLIEYFITEDDALNNANAITNPTQYTNIVNPQTIYVRFANLNNGCFAFTSFEIEADELLGVEENNVTEVRVFPNPASDRVNLTSPFFSSESLVTLFDVNGQTIFSEVIKEQDNSLTLDISKLKTGIYFVRVTSEGHTSVVRIIKK